MIKLLYLGHQVLLFDIQKELQLVGEKIIERARPVYQLTHNII